MGKLITMPGRTGFEKLTHAELCEKLRAAYDQINAFDKQLQSIADAVFPHGDSERPGDLDDQSGEEIVEGVMSLHEYASRVLSENDRLRGELLQLNGSASVIAEVEAEFAASQSAAAEGEK